MVFMSVRYSDMGLDAIGARDFVARQRTPTYSQIVIIMLSAFLIGVSIVVSIKSTGALVTTLFALFGLIGWYVIYQLMRSRDMLLATEFQNALFASAMGLHNKFCLIIKRDGTIIYLDRSFQELFPDFTQYNHRSVEMLLKLGKVSTEQSEQVINSIARGTYERAIFDMSDARGMPHRIILSIEPITRPAGFIMLRGREFVENRSGKVSDATAPGKGSSIFNRTSMTLLSHVMETLKMGTYFTSPTGAMVFCNPILEEWLGYDEGEIVGRNLSITNLIPVGRNDNMSAEPIDLEGVVQMEKKVGGYIKVFVNQRIIRNEHGQVMGCTAVVHLYGDGASDVKKKTF